MASRATENRMLNRKGYTQGDTSSEPAPCEVCGKRVAGTRSWWRKARESLEAECYCRPCAMFRMFAQDMDELTKLKTSHAKLTEQLREARRVIMLYRRWEHADDVESITGDRADTERMLTDASFAAQDFVEKWENKITTI